MDQATVKAFVQIALPLIRERLGLALTTSERAEAILWRGRTGSAVRAVLDVEVLTYEANTLLNAASLVNRMVEQAAGEAASAGTADADPERGTATVVSEDGR